MGKVLGDRLRRLRIAKEWKQEEAADKLGVPRASLSTWELGLHIPQPASLLGLADLYDVSLDYLVKGEETVPATPSAPVKDESVGRRIRRLRIKRGFSMGGLATAMKVVPKAVYNWENDIQLPERDNVGSLAYHLNVTRDFLLTGRESPVFSAIKAQIRAGAPLSRLLAMVSESE